MVMKFKVGDWVEFISDKSTWHDTEDAFKRKILQFNKPYKIIKVLPNDASGPSVRVKIEKNEYGEIGWSVGIECLKLYKKTQKPNWF